MNGESLLVVAFTCAVVAIRVDVSVAACVVVVGLPASATSVLIVSAVAPVTSPVCVALLTSPLYCEFVALSPVFVPL